MNGLSVGIVGGCGFIGQALSSCLSRDIRVKLLDVHPPPPGVEGNNVTYTSCDIRDPDGLSDCLSDVDVVVHTAIVQIPLINEQKRLAYEVNITGTQNVCRAVETLPGIRGMILASSWHTMGERQLIGSIDEEYGFRPDKVEDRARLYAISKIAQESIVRFHDEMSQKVYGIVRMGTVLGDGMPKETAASIFIERGLRGEALTPFRHSMYRPMLYVDVDDVCRAYASFVRGILEGRTRKSSNSLSHIVNVYYPEAITIYDLAEIVRDTIIECTSGRTRPGIEIVDKGLPPLFEAQDKQRIRVSMTKARELLGIDRLLSPRESIEKIVRRRLGLDTLPP